jgi:uncharacterized protein (DUF58 family)
MFDFESAEKEDLTEGPSKASAEGKANLFDHRWVWMAVVVFFLGMFFRNTSLIAVTGFMLAVVIFAWNWNQRALTRIIYRRRFHHRRAFPDEALEVQIVVENHKWLPVTWLQIEDEWPMDFGPSDPSALAASAGPAMVYLINVYALRWHERVRRRYELLAKQRGVYTAGPVHFLSGDPFGLFEENSSQNSIDRLIVYPRVKTLEELGLDAKDPFGSIRAQQRMFEDPSRIMGVRDHQPDDSFRHIHWKATARTGALQVKQFEPMRTQSLVLCLNIASFPDHIRGVWPDMVEYVISVAASLAAWADEQGHAVGLAANATLAQTDRPLRTQPGRSRDQLANLLEAMAGITYFLTQDFHRFLIEESTRMPWGATLVAITGPLNESMLAALMQLRHSGRRIVLIVLGKTPAPEMAGILTYHLPIVEEPPEKATAAPIRLSEDGEASETPRQRYLRQRAEQQNERESQSECTSEQSKEAVP